MFLRTVTSRSDRTFSERDRPLPVNDEVQPWLMRPTAPPPVVLSTTAWWARLKLAACLVEKKRGRRRSCKSF